MRNRSEAGLINSLMFKISKRRKKCVQLSIDGGNSFLLEVHIPNLIDAERFILQAYMTYLEREKQVDEIHTGLDFKGILDDILESEAEDFDEKAIHEYLIVRLRDLPLN